MHKFGQSLHPERTRLIEFGRFAVENRARRGKGKPVTFDFLGFTHLCGRKLKNEGFIVKRKTVTKRLPAKLADLKEVLRPHGNAPIPEQGRWLKSVVLGNFNYHAVPGNMDALESFRTQVIRLWHRAFRRRSQRHRMTWERFGRIVRRWIPAARILHPYPNVRFFAMHPK